MHRKAILLPLVAAMAAASPGAAAQSREQLLEENRQLRAQLDQAGKGCAPDTSGTKPYRDGAVSAAVEALRVGPGESSRWIAVTASINLRNTGSSPIVLNYQKDTFSLTDDRGYRYELRSEGYDPAQVIKGIPVATRNRADTSAVMQPGESRTVTFLASRQMNDGQTPGSVFDINATFAEYVDEGQGRVTKGRQHPVAFIGVPAGGKPAAAVPDGTKRKASELAERLLKGLAK